jgi:flagellar biosynthesis protein FlhF
MKVEHFFAPDMRQAIRLVRDAQGPDAVILSNRKVEGGVEIISALGYQGGPAEPRRAQAAAGSDRSADAAPRGADVDESGAGKDAAVESSSGGASQRMDWVQDPAIVSMREEIKQLRGLLENQLAHLAWADRQRRQPLSAGVMRRLTGMEFDASLIEAVALAGADAPDEEHAWELALENLAATLPVTDHDVLDKGGVVALVGSTGVGKTTSVAKLAARYVLRHGQRHVALLTTDSYRIGAHEQLMTYGRLLGVPVQVAGDHKQLRSALNGLADKRLVLIDTAGMSQRDLRLSEQFSTLADSGIPLRALLVLSATAHRSVTEETISAFSGVSLDGAILTKVDEAASLGGVLSALVRRSLSLMFVADGQRVPEDIHPARAAKLVQQAAQLAERNELPGESVMAERFGGIRADVHV